MRHAKAVLVFALLAAPAVATGAEGLDKTLPFVVDDYAKALGEARAQKLPLFIEAWAPW
jgi:hypothetical protein